jgi:hypothetical protein
MGGIKENMLTYGSAMTKLSPAAQAVYDAVLEICPAPADEIAVAALRAAADQVVPKPHYSWEVSSENRFIRRQFLLIADELEGDHD